MPRLLLVPHGPEARRALWELVDGAKAGDLLAPVTVAQPSVYAGLSLRRGLSAAGRGGYANVRFMPLPRVAELLGAPRLAAEGRRPLTPPLRAEAVRAVLAEARGALGATASHVATERAVAATFRDLHVADEEALSAIGSERGVASESVELFRAFRGRTAGFYDEHDLARAAATAVDGGTPALIEIGHVVLHLPRSLSPAEETLVAALARAGRLSSVVGLAGDADADGPTAPLVGRLEALLGAAEQRGSAPPVGRAAMLIISAPEAEDEVREVARDLVARAHAGKPLHRAAVLYRVAEPYARVVPEVLGAAEVPWNGSSPRRLADSVAGRVLLGALELPRHDFARDQVSAWLASGPVRDPVDGRLVPSTRWDVLSRRAGVVRGLGQWRDRLAGYAAFRADELEASEIEGDDSARRAEWVAADRDDLARLGHFVETLAQRLEPPDPPTWVAWGAWAAGLLHDYLGDAVRRARWPDAEGDAASRVEAVLDALPALAELRPEADAETFRRALATELEVTEGRSGTFGRGVFVGSLRDAYGADFDVVYVVGMAESRFPPRGREDPLLPDAVRRACSPALHLHAESRAEERRDYLAALAAAEHHVLLYPRADPRGRHKHLPARWLLEAAGRAAGGGRIGAQALLDHPFAPWLRVIPSFEAALVGEQPAGSSAEHALRSLVLWCRAGHDSAAHPLVARTPALAAGIAAATGRGGRGFGPYDGHVGARSGLLPAGPTSPSALERWAACPFRYLLERVLRVREIERPEEAETLSALEKGGLVHAVLDEFVRTAPPRRDPTDGWTEAERSLLARITARHCDGAEARGVTGRPLLWRLERRRIERMVQAFLDTDERWRRDLGLVPRDTEVRFGFGGAGREAVETTLPGGRTIAFRGVIDRVDTSPSDSRIVVWDYKTGRSKPFGRPRDDLSRGHRLQLPVYALAAGDGRTPVEAYYWFVAEPEAGPLGYAVDAAVREEFAAVLGTVVAAIEAGVFPAYPGASTRYPGRGYTFKNCGLCAFDRICPPDRDRAWERARDDAAVAAFRDLAEPSDDEPESDETP